MGRFMKKILLRIVNRLLKPFNLGVVALDSRIGKYDAEVSYWKTAYDECLNWYLGKVERLWGVKSPGRNQMVKAGTQRESVIKTWLKLHQQKKYLLDLRLKNDSFEKMKLLDIGSGPYPSALAFKNCEVFCVDPLIPEYIKAGYPIHFYDNVNFVYGFGEKLPFANNFFDAVISVNALDHVDNFEKTAKEIGRVLRVDGKLRVHLHYHDKTVTEPIELNDLRVKKAFSWCRGFKKIFESNKKSDYVLKNPNEKYVVWSNFK